MNLIICLTFFLIPFFFKRMSTQFFTKLSQNYIEILNDNEYYDVTIEVGKDPDVKIFRAHMIILCYRSQYLGTLTSNKKKKNEGDLTHIEFPNISPEIFRIILEYIYGGIISLNEQEIPEILKILTAADQLHFQELTDYLQNYLIENKAEWIEQQFELIYQTSFQSNSLLELQKFCTDFLFKSPEKIFKSPNFTSLSEKTLISLIKRDDLQIDEVKIWEHVLEWGLGQNSTLISDPVTWSDDDFKMMKNTLQNCLPLIRFFGLSSKDFFRKVRPYRKLLEEQLYEDLLEYHFDPKNEVPNNILFPRSDDISSKTVNINIVSFISAWIDNVNDKNKFAHIKELYLPYEFKLLLRGSRDGFSPKKFHELCDDIPRTVTFIKVKETGEIVGGYNPLIWKSGVNSGEWGKTKDSFIFSFKNSNNINDPVLSRVKDINKAVAYHFANGPTFSTDLVLAVHNNTVYGNDLSRDSRDYTFNQCKQNRYEKRIRNTEDLFSIEDYEIFQIITKKDKQDI